MYRRLSTVSVFLCLVVGVLMRPTPASAQSAELFFSEYIEGTSNNKALEIFNGTGAPVNLAAGGACTHCGSRAGVARDGELSTDEALAISCRDASFFFARIIPRSSRRRRRSRRFRSSARTGRRRRP